MDLQKKEKAKFEIESLHAPKKDRPRLSLLKEVRCLPAVTVQVVGIEHTIEKVDCPETKAMVREIAGR